VGCPRTGMPGVTPIDTAYNLWVVSNDVEAIRDRAGDLARTYQDFKAALVEMRERHGLTQEEVGRRLGISQEAVSKFESYDSNPTLANVRRYALAIEARLRLEVLDDTAIEPPTGALVGEEPWLPAATRSQAGESGMSSWGRPRSTAPTLWRETARTTRRRG
jgi:transcriptional regulator with XRE-family HTH domain